MVLQPAQSHRAPASVVIAVRHERVRAALWALLEADPLVEPVAATADAEDLMTLLGRITPAAVVIDDAILAQTGVVPGTVFVVFGMEDHPGYAARAREMGAADYVRFDEAERLGPALIEAAEPPVPFRAGRRRTGRRG